MAIGDFSDLVTNSQMKKVLSDVAHLSNSELGSHYKLTKKSRHKCTSGPTTWYKRAGINLSFWNGAQPYAPGHKSYKKGKRSATIEDMKAPLLKSGFQIVWSGTGEEANSYLKTSGLLRPGDVATMLSSNSGHAAMWTGLDWRSDFLLDDKPYPYSLPGRGGNETFILWRHPKLLDNEEGYQISDIKITPNKSPQSDNQVVDELSNNIKLNLNNKTSKVSNLTIKWKSYRPKVKNKWGIPADKNYTNSNAIALINFLISKGLPKVAAIGVAGSMMGEVAFNPYKSGHDVNGPSGGIAQWHDGPDSNNFTRLKRYAKSLGKPWTDIETQANFLWSDISKKLLNLLKAAKTVEDAAFIWGNEYEKFIGHEHRKGKAHRQRALHARNLLSLYNKLYGDTQNVQNTNEPMLVLAKKDKGNYLTSKTDKDFLDRVEDTCNRIKNSIGSQQVDTDLVALRQDTDDDDSIFNAYSDLTSFDQYNNTFYDNVIFKQPLKVEPANNSLFLVNNTDNLESGNNYVDYRKAFYDYMATLEPKSFQLGGSIFKLGNDLNKLYELDTSLYLPKVALDYVSILKKAFKNKKYDNILSSLIKSEQSNEIESYQKGKKIRLGHPEDSNFEDDIYYNPSKEVTNKTSTKSKVKKEKTKKESNDNTFEDDIYFNNNTLISKTSKEVNTPKIVLIDNNYDDTYYNEPPSDEFKLEDPNNKAEISEEKVNDNSQKVTNVSEEVTNTPQKVTNNSEDNVLNTLQNITENNLTTSVASDDLLNLDYLNNIVWNNSKNILKYIDFNALTPEQNNILNTYYNYVKTKYKLARESGLDKDDAGKKAWEGIDPDFGDILYYYNEYAEDKNVTPAYHYLFENSKKYPLLASKYIKEDEGLINPKEVINFIGLQSLIPEFYVDDAVKEEISRFNQDYNTYINSLNNKENNPSELYLDNELEKTQDNKIISVENSNIKAEPISINDSDNTLNESEEVSDNDDLVEYNPNNTLEEGLNNPLEEATTNLNNDLSENPISAADESIPNIIDFIKNNPLEDSNVVLDFLNKFKNYAINTKGLSEEEFYNLINNDWGPFADYIWYENDLNGLSLKVDKYGIQLVLKANYGFLSMLHKYKEYKNNLKKNLPDERISRSNINNKSTLNLTNPEIKTGLVDTSTMPKDYPIHITSRDIDNEPGDYYKRLLELENVGQVEGTVTPNVRIFRESTDDSVPYTPSTPDNITINPIKGYRLKPGLLGDILKHKLESQEPTALVDPMNIPKINFKQDYNDVDEINPINNINLNNGGPEFIQVPEDIEKGLYLSPELKPNQIAVLSPKVIDNLFGTTISNAETVDKIMTNNLKDLSDRELVYLRDLYDVYTSSNIHPRLFNRDLSNILNAYGRAVGNKVKGFYSMYLDLKDSNDPSKRLLSELIDKYKDFMINHFKLDPLEASLYISNLPYFTKYFKEFLKNQNLTKNLKDLITAEYNSIVDDLNKIDSIYLNRQPKTDNNVSNQSKTPPLLGYNTTPDVINKDILKGRGSDGKPTVDYSKASKTTIDLMDNRWDYYKPFIDSAFSEYDLPEEFKYIPFISNLDPSFLEDGSGRAGLWLFDVLSGKNAGYDKGNALEINSLVDERLDPVKSSKAAAYYLSKLLHAYKNEKISIAAFLYGITTVNKAIAWSRGTSKNTVRFEDIVKYLPKNAARNIDKIYKSFAFFKNRQRKTNPDNGVEVLVNDRMDLRLIASVLQIPILLLRDYNPLYMNSNTIPGNIKPYKLILPPLYVDKFKENYDNIKNYYKDYFAPRAEVLPGTKKETGKKPPR